MEDPIVEEVREVARQIWEECGGTSEGYYRHLLEIQERHKDRLVRPGPPPPADDAPAHESRRHAKSGARKEQRTK